MEQTQSQQMRQEQRQVLRMEQANLLDMTEDEFHRLITEVEHSPLFRRMYQMEKLVRYQRFPRTDISSSFYQLREDAVADEGSADVESLLAGKEYVISQIRKLGLEKFKRYFLFPEPGMTAQEIARECGLSLPEVQKILDLMDDFSVVSEFSRATEVSPGIRYCRVASIEKDAGGLVIGFLSAHLARGGYTVDYEAFERLAASGGLNAAEVKETRQLFRKLELINSRKDTLTQILRGIVDKQAPYLESGDAKSLLPYTQKELAGKIGIAPSSVSRAISAKSIDTPWGTEVPLKHFFPRPKRFRKELLRQALESGDLSSDEATRTMLREKLGVAISRRSVASLRKELGFPVARARAAHGRRT